MKSSVCYLIGNKKMVTAVLDETEKTAKYAGLGKRETLHLCLLAEELVGILLGLAGKFRAEFWIEEGGGTFQLFLTADARLGRENRKKLIALASSGKHEAHQGIMGKIGQLVEAFMDNYDEVEQYCARNGYMMTNMDIGIGESSVMAGGYHMWSLNQYQEEIRKDQPEDEWEELGCSIVAKLADDVTVSIQNHKVRIMVVKRFS